MIIIVNQMYSTGGIKEQQKCGIVLCLPKTTPHKTPADYRPTNLLDADCKILTRIVVGRLRPIVKQLLHPRQHGGCKEVVFVMLSQRFGTRWRKSRRHKPLCVPSLWVSWKRSTGSPTSIYSSVHRDMVLIPNSLPS